MNAVLLASSDLDGRLSDLAELAQGVYDEWEQDEEGYDVELGTGGACDLVAERFASFLSGLGLDAYVRYVEADCHTSVVAVLADGIFIVDVPPDVYETGFGYVWRKRPDILIGPEDVVVCLLSRDPADLHLYVDDPPSEVAPRLTGTVS